MRFRAVVSMRLRANEKYISSEGILVYFFIHVEAYVPPILAYKETSCDYMEYSNIISTFLGYDISFDTSLIKVGWLGGGEQLHHTDTTSIYTCL